MSRSHSITRALMLITALVLPAFVIADETSVSKTRHLMTIIIPHDSAASFVGIDVHFEMLESGTLAIKAVQTNSLLLCYEETIGLLDPRRMAVDLDDFGGPFGWSIRPLANPVAAVSERGGAETVAEPEQSCK